MKKYLYHMVPKNMKGDVLYPLNELKEIDNKIYGQQVSKYQSREFVMDRIIPTLNCLWNDVLHFSPVHPKELKKELEKLDQDFSGKFLKIDPEMLDKEKTTVYLFKNEKRSEEVSADNFIDFNIEDLSKYSELPEVTVNYYKKMLKEGKRPLLFVRIPHILYQGSINIDDCEIVEI